VEGADQAIYAKLADICLSMKAEDWLELPERIDNAVTVRLPEQTKAAYERLERDLLLPFKTGGDVVAANAAALTGKLLQVANGAVCDETGAVREIHDTKLEALEEVIEATNGKPVLVSYGFRHDLDRLRRRLPQARELRSAKDIEDWNAGRVPVLLVHPANAGHGLNLQDGVHIAVWFGLPWSLELYQQACARLHRQGQTERVIVHHIVAAGTVDEDVMRG
jgi:SNF2 family DNA or RNA helicase